MPSDPNTVAVAITAAVTTLTKESYEDSLGPSAKVIGEIVALPPRFLRSVLFPLFKRVAVKEKEYQDWLESHLLQKLAGIPEDRLQEPPLALTMAVLERAPLVYDEIDLREMYTHLLVAAMDNGRADVVHPSFPYIIEQLSPHEARLFKLITRQGQVVVAEGQAASTDGAEYDMSRVFDALCHSVGIELPQTNAALDNLRRLRLVRLDWSRSTALSHEPALFQAPVSGAFVHTSESCQLNITDYGMDFAAACIGDEPKDL